jgi:hypothetical protein
MSDKAKLCTGCGRFNVEGASLDLDDGVGPAWTCTACARRFIADGAGGLVTEPKQARERDPERERDQRAADFLRDVFDGQ